jgi:hypothetical protein
MQINNVSSTNFKALRIDPKAAEYLRKCDVRTLENIEKAGEKLANTRFVDVSIGQYLGCNIFADRKAFVNPNRNFVIGDFAVSRDNFLGKPFDRLSVKDKNDKLLRGIGDIDKLTEIAVSIDNKAIEDLKTSNSSKIVESSKNVDDAVMKLLDIYGE